MKQIAFSVLDMEEDPAIVAGDVQGTLAHFQTCLEDMKDGESRTFVVERCDMTAAQIDALPEM